MIKKCLICLVFLFTFFITSIVVKGEVTFINFEVYDSSDNLYNCSIIDEVIIVENFDVNSNSFYFNATLNSPTATINYGETLILLNQNTDSQAIPFPDEVIEVKVTITTDTDVFEYTLKITKGKKLYDLNLNKAAFQIKDQDNFNLNGFWNGNTYYCLDYDYSLVSVSMTLFAVDPSCSLYINNVLLPGNNVNNFILTGITTIIVVKVEAPDKTNQIYNIHISRNSYSVDPTLKLSVTDLVLKDSTGALVTFNPNTFTYYIDLEYEATSFRINVVNKNIDSTVSGAGVIQMMGEVLTHKVTVSLGLSESIYFFIATKEIKNFELEITEVNLTSVTKDGKKTSISEFKNEFSKDNYNYGPYTVHNNCLSLNAEFDTVNAISVEYIGLNKLIVGLNVVSIIVTSNKGSFVYNIQVIRESMEYTINEKVSGIKVVPVEGKVLTYSLSLSEQKPSEINYLDIVTIEKNQLTTVEILTDIKRDTRLVLLKVSDGNDFAIITIKLNYNNPFYNIYYQLNGLSITIIASLVGLIFFTILFARRDRIRHTLNNKKRRLAR